MSEEDSKEDRINNWDDQNVFVSCFLTPRTGHSGE